MKERFPHERNAIDTFFRLVYAYANQMLATYFFKDPAPTREKYPEMYAYAFKTAADVLDELFTDPLLKAVISVYWGYIGLPPDRLAFPYLAMIFFTYIEFKPFHIKGGSQALSNVIADTFLSRGGTVRYNCGVEKILVEKGAVRGVVTQDGEHIQSRFVVSNASQVSTYVGLMDPGQVPEEITREMRGRSLSPSAFTLFAGFDCEPDALGFREPTNFLLRDLDISDRALGKMAELEIGNQPIVLSCYDVADPDFSPSGTCQANIVTLKYGRTWLKVPPREYHRVKFQCAEEMLGRVEEIYPGIRDHIEELEVATPLTHMRYLGHPEGAIYGYEQYLKDSMFFQPGRFSPSRGALFCQRLGGGLRISPDASGRPQRGQIHRAQIGKGVGGIMEKKKAVHEDFDGYGDVIGEIEYSRKFGVDYTREQTMPERFINRLHPDRLRLRVSDIIEETASDRTFRFVCENQDLPPFLAGQYLSLSVETEGILTSRPYSISSPPNQTGFWDITVRRVESGLVSGYLFDQVKKGDIFNGSGPHGNFYHNPLFHDKTGVFIAGGAGVTPFMSMIREIAQCGLNRRVHLFLGSRTLEEIPFHHELTATSQKHENIEYIPVIENPSEGYRGETGLITGALLLKKVGEKVGDLANKTYYLCGPQGLYDFCVPELKNWMFRTGKYGGKSTALP